jgi:hypothetical protein
LLIVLLNVPTDAGVWYTRCWTEGALKKLHDDILAQLPQGATAAFEQASIAELTIPVNSVLFLQVASPSDISDPDSSAKIESFLKQARLARLHAALARDPRSDPSVANEAPVFLLRSQHKYQGQVFSFPIQVGRAARPSDGNPSWFAISQQDVSPESQTISYAQAVAAWLSNCPLEALSITTLYMKHAVTSPELRAMLQVLFELREQPQEVAGLLKAVLGVVNKTGLIQSRNSLYYITPASLADMAKQLGVIAKDPRAEALVCAKFKVAPKPSSSWQIARTYSVDDCETHLTYFKQSGGHSESAKRALGLP